MAFKLIHGNKGKKGEMKRERTGDEGRKDNLAFMPFVHFLNIIGIDLLKTSDGKTNKSARFLHSTLVLSCIILSTWLLSDDAGGAGGEIKSATANIVVRAITCINNRCINFTFIIVYAASAIESARKSKRHTSNVFEHFHRIDTCLKRLDERISSRTSGKLIVTSKWFAQILLLMLLLGTHCRFVSECFNDKMFDVGQFLHVMLVFILSVEISFYCMICASIKARFIALHKYLRQRTRAEAAVVKSRESFAAAGTPRRTIIMMATSKPHEMKPNEKLEFVSSQSSDVLQVVVAGNEAANDEMMEFKSISSIYDGVLEIIALMNESFSLLLSVSFGKILSFHVANAGELLVQ